MKQLNPKTQNPFYDNHVFNKEDIGRAIIKWWKYPLLLLLPTWVQLNEGYVFYWKTWQGKYFLMKVKPLSEVKEAP